MLAKLMGIAVACYGLPKVLGSKPVSLVVVFNPLGRILLVKRSASDKWKPNCWALPGGRVEKEESYSEAAKRELLEETNILALSWDDRFSYQGMNVFVTSNWVGPLSLVEASHGSEHSAWIWVPLDQLVHLRHLVPRLKSDKFVKLLQVLG